ncbi:MAG: RNA polymerase sigma factor [Stenotrophobium sp.]
MNPDAADSTQALVEAVYRSESRAVLATLIRLLGDFDLAEEALHEAFRAALEQWPQQGVPHNPRAWLVSAGRFKAIDNLRRQSRFEPLDAEVHDHAADEAAELESDSVEDDRLRLIFTCCHPALTQDAQVALTLREVCGLTTEEIAQAFLTPAPTLAQRIVRAKTKIRDARIPYEVPGAAELPERLAPVLRVIYLVFNEGYVASSGASLTRHDLSAEAIRLGRLLAGLLPAPTRDTALQNGEPGAGEKSPAQPSHAGNRSPPAPTSLRSGAVSEPEVLGLLALMLLHDSRRLARVSGDGELVLLDEQDRALWNSAQIEEGAALVRRSLVSRRFGPYTLQAAIAAVHAQAPAASATDWGQIVELYGVLMEMEPSPIVELNRAVAVAMRDGAQAGLALVDAVLERGELADYRLAHAARADLCRRLGRKAEARAAYEQALALTRQEAEQGFLKRRLAELEK